MVQEVQQQGNRYQTPNEIQGIWNIRRRVKEHTQVTPQFTTKCEANWAVDLIAPWWSWSMTKWTFTVTSQSGEMEFKVVDGWIRIPRAWIYKITIDAKGYIYGTCYHYMRSGNKDLFYATTVWSWTGSAEAIVNLGKYSLLEYRGRLTYSSSITNPQSETCTITLQLL